MTDQAAETPFEELRESAIRHYNEASSAVGCFDSFVMSAIRAYNPSQERVLWETNYFEIQMTTRLRNLMRMMRGWHNRNNAEKIGSTLRDIVSVFDPQDLRTRNYGNITRTEYLDLISKATSQRHMIPKPYNWEPYKYTGL